MIKSNLVHGLQASIFVVLKKLSGEVSVGQSQCLGGDQLGVGASKDLLQHVGRHL